MQHLTNSSCDLHIFCTVNKIVKMSRDNMHPMFIYNSECVQYLCKLLKAQEYCAVLEEKCIRIQLKI